MQRLAAMHEWAWTLRSRSSPTALISRHVGNVSLRNASLVSLGISVARDKIVFNQAELTGNIWMTTLPQ